MWITAVSAFRVLTIREGPLRHWVSWVTSPPLPPLPLPPPTPPLDPLAPSPRRSARVSEIQSVTDSLQRDIVASDERDDTEHAHLLLLKTVCVLLLNSLIVGGVYSAYILAVSQSLRPSPLVAVQVLVALFKVVWNMAVVPLLARMMLLILNTIFLPCISTVLTSPSFFQ